MRGNVKIGTGATYEWAELTFTRRYRTSGFENSRRELHSRHRNQDIYMIYASNSTLVEYNEHENRRVTMRAEIEYDHRWYKVY